ncbi:hypothetical protein AHiyo8_54190 [Arthrobacter sp. Hiyo8]|nr:hypothetical protein AHiyo8_54190 [Arthrobacter sp. Hiyo8]
MDAEMCPGKWTSWTGFRRNCLSSNSSASAAQPAAVPRRDVSEASMTSGESARNPSTASLTRIAAASMAARRPGPSGAVPRAGVTRALERIVGEDRHLRSDCQRALRGQRVFAQGLGMNGSGRCPAGLASCPTGKAGQLGKER